MKNSNSKFKKTLKTIGFREIITFFSPLIVLAIVILLEHGEEYSYWMGDVLSNDYRQVTGIKDVTYIITESFQEFEFLIFFIFPIYIILLLIYRFIKTKSV